MRVVAGVARGRRLEAPRGRGTRPTSDRVREAVFNTLGSLDAVNGAVVVDLFAGSGAMGIEALSRGAREAVFVESDARAAAAVGANLRATGLAEQGRVLRAGVERWLASDPGHVDLALVDPPYDWDGWPGLLAALDADVAVLESDREIDPGTDWLVLRMKRYGTTVVTIVARQRARRRADDTPGEEEAAVTTVLYPGSFDPFHNGHRELVETAAYLFDHVVIAAMRNPQKGEPLFDLPDRMAMIEESLAHLDNVEVTKFSSLVVNLAREVGANFILKGLRAPSDFENEMAQAQMNLAVSGVHTLFLPSASANSFIASKFVREIARFGGDVSELVPEPVTRRLKEKYGK